MILVSKAAARDGIWRALEERCPAAYPFPVRGHFRGAAETAKRLFHSPLLAEAQQIKVNHDSPQRFARAEALRRGTVVYVPTPRLASGFMHLNPARIDPADILVSYRPRKLAAVRDFGRLGQPPQFRCYRHGLRRCYAYRQTSWQWAGYSVEFATLREFSHPPVPVAISVHDEQVVEDFLITAHDQPLSLIATPTRTIKITQSMPAPAGID